MEMGYKAPVEDILFALDTAVGLDELIERGVYDGLDVEGKIVVMLPCAAWKTPAAVNDHAIG